MKNKNKITEKILKEVKETSEKYNFEKYRFSRLTEYVDMLLEKALTLHQQEILIWINEFKDKILNQNTNSKNYIELLDFEYHLKELKEKITEK